MAPPDADVWAGLAEHALPVGAVHEFLADERAGGTAVFVGTTRRWTGEAETAALDYHAYPAMAEASLTELAEDARQRGAIRAVALHRLGVVRPTEASVVVGVASAHRDVAFAECRRLIDRLKAETPIWKRDLRPHDPRPYD